MPHDSGYIYIGSEYKYCIVKLSAANEQEVPEVNG
jgi:hypothetical protein